MGTFKSKWHGIPIWLFFVMGVAGLALYLSSHKKSGSDKAAANQSATDLGSASSLANLFQEAWPMPYMGGDVYINNTNNVPGSNTTGGTQVGYRDSGPGGRINAPGPFSSGRQPIGMSYQGLPTAPSAVAQTNSIINQSMPSQIPSFSLVTKSLSSIGTINGTTVNSGAGMIPNRATISTGTIR